MLIGVSFGLAACALWGIDVGHEKWTSRIG